VRRTWLVLAVIALSVPLLAQRAGPPAGPPKIQTLIITGQQMGHNWKAVTPELRKVLEDTGLFEVRITEEFRGAGPETLAPYSLVVLNYQDRQPDQRWGDRADQALLEYVRSGKGLVMFHFGVAAFNGWEEYEKLSGCNWRANQGHHSAAHDFIVDIRDFEHPITRGLKKSLPQPKDELYANLKCQPEGSFHVLATAYDDHSLYGGKARQPIPGPGLDRPSLWTLNYGKGRVFANMLGHDVAAVNTPTFITTFTRGAEWAATGNVTLPVPPELKQ
jgi:type 1 glutamine amidotransferase